MSIYPNGKGVVCKTTDFNQNWFDSNSTQLILIIIASLLYFEKKTNSIIYVTTLNGITLNAQLLSLTLIFFFNNVRCLLIFKFFKKIQVFYFFKKVNKSLMFNKISVLHIMSYLCILIIILNGNIKKKDHLVKLVLTISITLLLGIIWSSLEVL